MEPIDDLIRGAMPRAPRGIAEAVDKRLAARKRTRRAFAGVGLFVAAAAALVLWLVARPARVPQSSWMAKSATLTTIDGMPIVVGRALPVGALVHVGDGGGARLERPSAGETARVELSANTDARVADGALELLTGSARLEGPEARLTGDVADVTTLGVGAAATVQLRRNPMLTKNAAALAALLTVGVVDGGARVQAKGHDPLLLAKNDRTMIAPKLPPLTTRAPAKTTPASAKKPTPTPAAAKSTSDTKAIADGDLDKGAFRAAVRTTLGDIQSCYEAALAQTPGIGGRIVFQLRVVTANGKGHIADGEVQPNEGDLNAPGLQQCMLQALAKAEFPPSVDGDDVIVSYPFVLKAADEAE